MLRLLLVLLLLAPVGAQTQADLAKADKAVRKNPANPNNWLARGRIQFALGQTVPAFKSLREAGKRNHQQMVQVAEKLLPASNAKSLRELPMWVIGHRRPLGLPWTHG